LVFQKPNPFPQSIYNNVAMGPRSLGLINREKLADTVEQLLRRVNLWDEIHGDTSLPALSLSLGQQQRLCIARTLAVKPDVILMDEPCSALDPIATLRIEDLMRELRKDYTILIVTHNMQQAARVSDYTALFWLGKLVEHARTKKLFTRPSEEMTEAYISGHVG
jgi:phosphate transport system ATP-binding protein